MGELVGTVCAVLLSRQNVGPLVSRRTQTGITKMAQWRHSLRVFGLYRFTGYYLAADALLAHRTIFVTSLLAIVAGIVGKGPLETPTFVCSLLCRLVLALALLAE